MVKTNKPKRKKEIVIKERLKIMLLRNAVLLPGGAMSITLEYMGLAKIYMDDPFCIVVTADREDGNLKIPSLGTLSFIKKATPMRKQDGTPFVSFDMIGLRRVALDKFSKFSVPEGASFECDWRAIDEPEVTSKFWENAVVKQDLQSLRTCVSILCGKLLGKFEKSADYQKFEDLAAVIWNLSREAGWKNRHKRVGSILDEIVSCGFEIYVQSFKTYIPEAIDLSRQALFAIKLDERLRKTVLWVIWLVGNFDRAAEIQEAGNKNNVGQSQTDEGVHPLHKRFEEIKNNLPEEAKKEVERQLARLKRDTHSVETAMVENHLNLILNLPWGIYTQDTKDLRGVKRILDEDHAGLDKIKERILESIAVRQLNPAAKSPILCFVGPPGVGKTSLGKSIARALGRKFTRLSLGGLKDEADIRGHRGTYINAMPGQIISSIKKCGSANPVFMLDEIEKVGKGWNGDPAAALLEVLDPEQNFAFSDHYLNVHFDLSQVLFITTANILDTILSALQDRMEIIEIPGYTPLEKLQIAKSHLIGRRRVENGFPVTAEDGEIVDVTFTDEAIYGIIHQYTYEAGVRNLEREIDRAFRRVAKKYKSGDLVGGTIAVTDQNLHTFCGKPLIVNFSFPAVLPPGVMPVLVVTGTGGEVVAVEVEISHHPGRRKITIAGVRKSGDPKDSINKIGESFENAFDALCGQGGILSDMVRNLEQKGGPLLVKGNVTNGSMPKDGPSAGISIFIAIYSALRKKSIKPTPETPLLGATGEISLKFDEIGAVGGIRDKTLAAHRKGIRRLIIPIGNESDLEDIPSDIRDQMDITTELSRWEALIKAIPEDEEFIRSYLESRQQGS